MDDKPSYNLAEQNKDLTGAVIGAAIEVHKHCGPGLLESAYQECLIYELKARGFDVEAEVYLPFNYKGHLLSKAYVVDLLVEKKLIVELKSVGKVLPVHKNQVKTYLKGSNLHLGLLINFNAELLTDDIHRIIVS
jgi:GxxExxY protein